ALIAQQRRFLKPLRYDARTVASFPNALLLDAGAQPRPLHVVSAFMSAKDRAAKEKAAQAIDGAWVWRNDEPMPPLPAVHIPSWTAAAMTPAIASL
ncbi:MAG: DUF1173 family protein, partial [Xanthomonadaceae bacterium]|nr:DUF1173 family protein [Xanthomonadaceae bacterium]